MSMCWTSLSEDVHDVLVALDVKELEDALRDPVADHAILDVAVCPVVVDHVLSDAASSDVVHPCSDEEDDKDQLVEKVSEVQPSCASVGGRDILCGHIRLLDEVHEGAVDEHAAPRVGIAVDAVMSPVRVRNDDHGSLLLGDIVGQLDVRKGLDDGLEAAKISDEDVPVSLCCVL